jgi:hypothetical protein
MKCISTKKSKTTDLKLHFHPPHASPPQAQSNHPILDQLSYTALLLRTQIVLNNCNFLDR